MNPGDKVTYIGNPHKGPEKGIVKSLSDSDHRFVVFSCANDWGSYAKYTAVRCKINELVLGWTKGIFEQVTVEGVNIECPGDPSVGLFDQSWTIPEEIQFESSEDKGNFFKGLESLFELYVTGETVFVNDYKGEEE